MKKVLRKESNNLKFYYNKSLISIIIVIILCLFLTGLTIILVYNNKKIDTDNTNQSFTNKILEDFNSFWVKINPFVNTSPQEDPSIQEEPTPSTIPPSITPIITIFTSYQTALTELDECLNKMDEYQLDTSLIKEFRQEGISLIEENKITEGLDKLQLAYALAQERLTAAEYYRN